MNSKIDIDQEWNLLIAKLAKTMGKMPDLNAILFLIGIQELGKSKKSFSKEEKQDLMHIGVCTILSQSGYYQFEKRDEEGWPHFKLLKPVPKLDLIEQEKFLQMHIKEYFAGL